MKIMGIFLFMAYIVYVPISDCLKGTAKETNIKKKKDCIL